LRTHGKNSATVVAIHNHSGYKKMHDLTVADVRTYHVLAGATPVMVHNCGSELSGKVRNLAEGNITDTGDTVHLSSAGLRTLISSISSRVGETAFCYQSPRPRSGLVRTLPTR